MSSLEELKNALKDTLAARGTLGQIQARVRAEIFNALEETEEPQPQLSQENLIINELIRDYLEFNHYKHTLAVLEPETGMPAERINRAFLAQELGMREDSQSKQLPLLYSITARLIREKTHRPAQGSLSLRPAVGGGAESGVSLEGASAGRRPSAARSVSPGKSPARGYSSTERDKRVQFRSGGGEMVGERYLEEGRGGEVRASVDPQPFTVR